MSQVFYQTTISCLLLESVEVISLDFVFLCLYWKVYFFLPLFHLCSPCICHSDKSEEKIWYVPYSEPHRRAHLLIFVCVAAARLSFIPESLSLHKLRDSFH